MQITWTNQCKQIMSNLSCVGHVRQSNQSINQSKLFSLTIKSGNRKANTIMLCIEIDHNTFANLPTINQSINQHQTRNLLTYIWCTCDWHLTYIRPWVSTHLNIHTQFRMTQYRVCMQSSASSCIVYLIHWCSMRDGQSIYICCMLPPMLTISDLSYIYTLTFINMHVAYYYGPSADRTAKSSCMGAVHQVGQTSIKCMYNIYTYRS